MTVVTDSIERKMCELAAEVVGADPAGVTPETNVIEDLNYDSLDAAEFTMKIEEAFEVSVPDEAAQGVRTVRHALELLSQLRASGGNGAPDPEGARRGDSK